MNIKAKAACITVGILVVMVVLFCGLILLVDRFGGWIILTCGVAVILWAVYNGVLSDLRHKDSDDSE